MKVYFAQNDCFLSLKNGSFAKMEVDYAIYNPREIQFFDPQKI